MPKSDRLLGRDGAGSTIIDGSGSGSVIVFINTGPDAILQGFTIQNGSAVYGGGIHCINSSPMIKHCTISGNSAKNFGGGIYCRDDSSPSIEHCTISGNLAQNSGGGIYCFYSSPIISDSTISGNSAGRYGGGFYSTWYSSPTLVDSTMSGDTASIADDEVHLGLVASINFTDTGLANDDMEMVIPQDKY